MKKKKKRFKALRFEAETRTAAIHNNLTMRSEIIAECLISEQQVGEVS